MVLGAEMTRRGLDEVKENISLGIGDMIQLIAGAPSDYLGSYQWSREVG